MIIQNLNGINTLLIEYKTKLEELQLFSSLWKFEYWKDILLNNLEVNVESQWHLENKYSLIKKKKKNIYIYIYIYNLSVCSGCYNKNTINWVTYKLFIIHLETASPGLWNQKIWFVVRTLFLVHRWSSHC